MGKYKALRSCIAYPYDAATPDIEPGTVFDVDERDPAAKAYIEAVMETPGAVEKVGAKAKEPKAGEPGSYGKVEEPKDENSKPEDKGEGK
ncbi:MAG TPA: hypothetical protein VMX79_01810 [bacterium]|nr:hypothetical protein [bacterium]